MGRQLVHGRNRVVCSVACAFTELRVRLVIAVEVGPAVEAPLNKPVYFLRRQLIPEPITPIVDAVELAATRLPIESDGVAKTACEELRRLTRFEPDHCCAPRIFLDAHIAA